MEEKVISVNNLKINYRIAGSGPAILILHGWGSNSERWQRVGDTLAENGFKAIIPDLPGFGKSQTPSEPWGYQSYCEFTKSFAKNLNLEKFSLLGSSFGGALAMKYAAEYPQNIEKLFLVAAAYVRRKTLKRALFFVVAKASKLFSFLPFFNLGRRAFYKFIVRKSDYSYTLGVMKQIYSKVIREDLSYIAPLIKSPTIIIWGESDDITPLKNAYFLKENIEGSHLITVNGLGHSLSRYEKLAEIILKHLK